MPFKLKSFDSFSASRGFFAWEMGLLGWCEGFQKKSAVMTKKGLDVFLNEEANGGLSADELLCRICHLTLLLAIMAPECVTILACAIRERRER